MRKFLKSDTSIRVISVLISILLWMYVVGVNNPTVSVVLKGIPVQITNNEGFDATGLKVINVSHQTVDVKIEGRHSEVSKVSAADVEASIDVSDIKRSGTYALDIILNSADNGVRYTNITSESAKIFADFVIAVNKDITTETTGVPKEGCAVESVSATDSKILIRGPKSIVDKVDKVTALADVEGADGDISKNYPLRITDASGKDVDLTYVTTNITETLVDIKFTQTKEVLVNPVFTNPKTSDYDIKISPEKIKITGNASIVKSLSKIDTEQIEITDADLPTEGESKKLSSALKLPEGVFLAEETSTDIEITVTPEVR